MTVSSTTPTISRRSSTTRCCSASISSPGPWQQTLAGRTQHYGYRYDYRARRIDASFALGPLPDWLHAIAHRIYTDGLVDHEADQAIVNEYAPGQGITDHIDCTPCFADGIASLSLAAPAASLILPFAHLIWRYERDCKLDNC